LRIGVVVHGVGRALKRNPLGEVAEDPKRYQVSFLAGKLPPATRRKLEEAVKEPEQLVVRSVMATAYECTPLATPVSVTDQLPELSVVPVATEVAPSSTATEL